MYNIIVYTYYDLLLLSSAFQYPAKFGETRLGEDEVPANCTSQGLSEALRDEPE